MAQWQGKSRKKRTGGVRRYHRKKRKFEIGRELISPTIGETRSVPIRSRGGNEKRALYSVDVANVTDPSTGETERAEITDVVENEANPHYVRRNIITKGAVIETDAGRARVTSRPGQQGQVNAVLVD